MSQTENYIKATSPKLSQAISTKIKENSAISQSLKNRKQVTFEVKGGQLRATNSRGEVLYQGAQGEFEDHKDVKINANPEKRRLGELLLDRETLRDKHSSEGRSDPKLSHTSNSEQKLKTEYENRRIKEAPFNGYRKSKNAAKTLTSPIRGIGKLISWGRTSASDRRDRSRVQGLSSRER